MSIRGDGLRRKASSCHTERKEKMMHYKTRKRWRKIKYWLIKKMFTEEEWKVFLNIQMGFYGYEKKGETE